MDYTTAPLLFRLRKTLRYVRLYGPSRTLTKVRGQYHMRAVGRRGRIRPGRADAHVGIIGCGNFAYSHIAYFLEREHGAVVRGVMDVDGARAHSLARRYRAHYATEDARRVIEDPEIDLIYVASNHASHADYAIQALELGKSVHIEKPHVVTDDQLVRLCRAMSESTGQVRLGFNRPGSRLGRLARDLIDQEPGASVLNWFVAGHEISADHWYHRPEEGGRVLGNLCHWTDFVLQLVPAGARHPIEVHPARAAVSDTNLSVSYVFGEGTVAAITFSAKGHTFEGVRERFSAHCGDLLLNLNDFHHLEADVREKRTRIRLRFRDHGHREAVLASYAMSPRSELGGTGVDVAYVWDTAALFLRTRDALETQTSLEVQAFDPALLEPQGSGAER
jgi:predicted dehydrogenase